MNSIKAMFEKPTRDQPRVWVKRLVIIETDQPTLKIVRDIKLQQGLNIIWAKEPDEDDPAAEISGHSAGKTTLCRLIRYVLGEKNFATKTNTRLIGQTFQYGYVGAELIVNGKQWSVIRPLKKGRHSYIKKNATVEELLANRETDASEGTYVQKLGLTAFLEELGCATIIESGQTIDWEHLLAWCARDQEARFQDVYGWRSARSESEWPALQHPKADALFLIRLVLGLFLPDELKKEEALGALKKSKDGLGKRIEELEREPRFRVNLSDRELRRRLKLVLPDETGIETMPLQADDPIGVMPSLERVTIKAVDKLDSEIAKIVDDRQKKQTEIDDLGGQIRKAEDDFKAIQAMFGLEKRAQDETAADFAQREGERKKIEEVLDTECPFGKVLFKDCDYVKNRRTTLQQSGIKDAHQAEQEEAKRAESADKFEEQKKALSEKITQLKGNQATAQRARDGYASSLRDAHDGLRDLKQSLENLKLWTSKQNDPGEFAELVELRNKLANTEANINKTEAELADLIKAHNDNQQKLANIFSAATKAVLTSGTYDGKVSFDDRALSFSITHGPAMSGEAIGTLAVLLTDISSLIYNAASQHSMLPGILIHDSPREADLGEIRYKSYLRFAASLQKLCPSLEKCPFQYIVTTTTEPPKELQTDDWVRLRLDASKKEGLLFGCNIADAAEGPEQTTFAP